MSAEIFKYVMVGAYVLATFILSWVGMRKTKSLAGFSIGNKDMNPYLVGMTLSASISSTATFVINPGFVYVHGLSAFLHFGVAATLGIIVALLLITKGFRRVGEQSGSLTVPDWIYHRYGSRWLATFFAFINLLSITFVVLILVGCAIITSALFGIDQQTSLVLVVLFVFSYVLMGGTYAHAYTNCMQGLMMALIAVFVFAFGLLQMQGSFMENLVAQGSAYAAAMNPESTLYFDLFSVFISGFFITAALMFQPHILTKVLYLKGDGDVTRFLATAYVSGACFALMLFVGFFARFSGLESAQDGVTMAWLQATFGTGSVWGPYVLAFVSVALLAAGMSTLDGILVALSAMVVNDIYNPLRRWRGGTSSESGGLMLSRVVLVMVGLAASALAWNPPQLVGLFAQKGVYGLAAASVVPIMLGTLYRGQVPVWIVAMAAGLGLGGHLFLHLVGGVVNPSVSACWGMFASATFTGLAWVAWRWPLWERLRAPRFWLLPRTERE